MPLKVYRLRRLLAVTAVLLVLVVAGMYFYARSRATNVLKQFPGKIGLDIKQTASGFQFSKSDGKRTLFTVQASDVKEFKLNGNAELHNVSIVLYGRDASRFDQIYGDDFAFNQKTGDVTAKGDVRIDLVANPTGLASPDQSTPKELKNPIHLKTRNLVFNKDSGNAMTAERVEFQTPQASGWAMGVRYSGKSNTLTLSSQIHVVLNGAYAAVIEADHGTISNEPREITLDHPHLSRSDGKLQSDRAVFYLGQENEVEKILATGDVSTEMHQEKERKAKRSIQRSNQNSAFELQPLTMRSRADQAEFLLEGKKDLLRSATMTGNFHFEQTGNEPMQAEAGRVIMDFAGENQLQKVHAVDGVRLTQKSAPANNPAPKDMGSGAQDFELTAPIIDFKVAKGHILEHAVTSGAARITVSQPQNTSPQAGQLPAGQRTVATAGKFDAQFSSIGGRDHLAGIHGAPDARIVNSTAGEPDRVSTSESMEASFLPQGGLDAITQLGNVIYTDGASQDKRMHAWANSARYTPSDQMLLLSGSPLSGNPRVANGGMDTTAKTIRINRETGEALAQGEVKSTYSELKEQPNGALLASSSPIHVTARSMTARNNPGVAVYTGNARLWQDANVIEAPSIQFDRDRRSVSAQGTPAQPVHTILSQREKVTSEKPASEMSSLQALKTGKPPFKKALSAGSAPISITAAKLTYADSERRAHYESGVVAKGADFTATAKTLDAYLVPRSQTSADQSFAIPGQPIAGPGQLDHMIAQGNVVIQQLGRRAEGEKLVYTTAADTFVLTGGPPSIFDAEQGKITGVSLTFFRGDGRVLVEGGESTPVVTQTRVAR